MMLRIALTVAAVVLATSAPAQNKPLQALRTDLQCLADQGKIPGAVTLVARDGTLIHSSVVGFQDVASHAPMKENTIFRFYSMSKPLTSVAILMLMEEDKLSLDDPLSRFVPAFRDMRVYVSGDVDHMVTEPARRPITIRDLLTHTSGLTYHFTGDTPVHQYYRKHGVKRNTPVGSLPTDAPAAPTLEELVERLSHAPLLHQPGQQFDYSYSTTVLGHVVERASGMKLDRFLHDKLFAPLRMKSTGFFVEGADLNRFVTNYLWTDTGLSAIETTENTDYKDRSRLLDGGGAIAGTARDYLRFAQMLVNGGSLDGVRILKPETVDLMFQDHLPASAAGKGMVPGVPFQFGYGFAVGNTGTAKLGTLPESAVGWDGSGNTFFWVDRKNKLVTVFMTQVITPKGPPAPLKKIVYQSVYALPDKEVVKVCN